MLKFFMDHEYRLEPDSCSLCANPIAKFNNFTTHMSAHTILKDFKSGFGARHIVIIHITV